MSEALYKRWQSRRFALSQSDHEAINARHYPGTRQLCCTCEQPTGRCEDDTMYCEACNLPQLCEECYDKHREHDDAE